MKSASTDTAQTLERGLQILKQLSVHPSGMTVAELSEALRIHRPIMYRLLRTLELHDFVARGANGSYLIGPAVLTLGRHAFAGLQEVAMPELVALAEELQATALLTTEQDGEVVVLACVEPRTAAIAISYRAGFRQPLTRGAAGLAILAGRPKVPRERKEISTAREVGYAVSIGQITPGAAGVAAPIKVAKDVVEGSIGAVTFAYLFDEAKFGPSVAAAAARISARLRPR